MKPSLTPCSFSKRSLYRLRRSMTGCMLTSLNVVRIAAVDCDCTRRSATRWRSRDIGTRCSGRAAERRRQRHRRARGGALAAGAAAAAGAARRAPRRRRCTSPLVMRPPRPVPSTVGGVDALLGHHLARGGQRGDARRSPAAAAPRRRRRRLRAAARRGRARPPRALASVSMTAITSWPATVEPSALTDLDQHAGAGRRQLEHDLVGLDVDQVLVARDRVARLLVPADERRLGHRLGQLRDFDFDCASCVALRVRCATSISPVGRASARERILDQLLLLARGASTCSRRPVDAETGRPA